MAKASTVIGPHAKTRGGSKKLSRLKLSGMQSTGR
jgi:hypothetical protein